MSLARGTTRVIAGREPGRSWQRTTLQLAVALAFADASIVVLALPRIVDELHTSISAVTWVIMAYNLALIVGVLAYLTLQNRFAPRSALLAGLALFGVASIGSGVADSLGMLVAMRCLQGAGGALLLCGSLPLLAGASDSGRSPAAGWSTAAAVGAAIGPAAGGLLTQAFDWRAIFLAQAPAAALAAAAVIGVHVRRSRPTPAEADANGALDAGTANVALLLLSAGLIGALFLVVVLLIDVWQLAPAGAAAVVSAIPLATIVAERLGRSGPRIALAAAGACLLALGLAGIAFIPTGAVGLVVLALLACGAGLGLGFTSLTAAALGGSGSATTRAGRTVAARDAGLVVGLLILTPIFVGDLNTAPQKAIPSVAGAVAAAPMPDPLKSELGSGLVQVYAATPQGSLPDLDPAFARVRRGASGPELQQLGALESQLQSTIETTVTHSFRRSFLFSALFALLVLPVLGLRLARARRDRPRASGRLARPSSRRQSASRRASPHPG